MKYQIALIRVGAIGFDLFGLAYFLLPQTMAGLFGTQLTTPAAIGDVRATYGGLACGMAVFLWLCAQPQSARLGLQLLLFTGIGLSAGRIASMIVDGPPNGIAMAFLALEAGTAVLSLIALRAPQARAQLQPSVAK